MNEAELYAQESETINNARRLVRECLSKEIPMEIFDAALDNYKNVSSVVASARASRKKKPLIKRIFNK